MSSNLFGFGAVWLVSFVLVYRWSHAWYVWLETQIATDINCECFIKLLPKYWLVDLDDSYLLYCTTKPLYAGIWLDTGHDNYTPIGYSSRQSFPGARPWLQLKSFSAILVQIHVHRNVRRRAAMDAVSALQTSASWLVAIRKTWSPLATVATS